MVEQEEGEAAAGEFLQGEEGLEGSGGVFFGAFGEEGGEGVEGEDAEAVVLAEGFEAGKEIEPVLEGGLGGEGLADEEDVAEAEAVDAGFPGGG